MADRESDDPGAPRKRIAVAVSTTPLAPCFSSRSYLVLLTRPAVVRQM